MQTRSSILVLLWLSLLPLVGCQSTERAKESHADGKTLWEQGKEEEAIAAFRAGLKEQPDAHEIRLSLARIYYERGENPHIEQRRLLAQVDAAIDRKDKKTASALEGRAEQQQLEATIHYKAANEQLDVILAKTNERELTAHAAYLRMRTAIFFEEWPIAKENIQRMIKYGEVKGTRKAKYEEFLKLLDSRAPKPLLPPED